MEVAAAAAAETVSRSGLITSLLIFITRIVWRPCPAPLPAACSTARGAANRRPGSGNKWLEKPTTQLVALLVPINSTIEPGTSRNIGRTCRARRKTFDVGLCESCCNSRHSHVKQQQQQQQHHETGGQRREKLSPDVAQIDHSQHLPPESFPFLVRSRRCDGRKLALARRVVWFESSMGDAGKCSWRSN